jgi:hypothetical protein
MSVHGFLILAPETAQGVAAFSRHVQPIDRKGMNECRNTHTLG